MPEIPDQIEVLRAARSRLVPWQTYRTEMPDGSIVETTGAEMIRDAEMMVALADAHERGDAAGVLTAMRRLLADD